MVDYSMSFAAIVHSEPLDFKRQVTILLDLLLSVVFVVALLANFTPPINTLCK